MHKRSEGVLAHRRPSDLQFPWSSIPPLYSRSDWFTHAGEVDGPIATRIFGNNHTDPKCLECKEVRDVWRLLEGDEGCPQLYVFAEENGAKVGH